jgi:segregation and condensation protein B
MTDEARETLDEENQMTLEQADLPPEDAQTPEQTVPELPDDEEETARGPVESLGREPVPEDESASEAEPVVEQRDMQTAESQVPDEEQQFAQESETPTDASAAMEETGEPREEGETTVQTEELATQEQEQQEPAAQEPEQAPTVESVIEAILFATDEPLTEGRLAGIVETTAKQVRASVESLNAKYEANNSAFRIEQIAGGYQMLTLSAYNHWLKKMVHVRSETKLSPAALETLAIIAYKQPIIRADIEAIRGVAVGEVIRSLMYKGLVKIVGRAEILGRPMLYGTTKKFLEVFGLNSLKDLPKAEDLKNPDR